MSTAVYPLLNYTYVCPGLVQPVYCEPVRGDPPLQHIPYEPFLKVTHSLLKVNGRPASPEPEPEPGRDSAAFEVSVFNASFNTKVPIKMKSMETIGKLKKRYVRKKPHMSGSLDLVLNGKPVLSEKTLGELGVKAGAVFITYQKCIGG